MWQKVLFHGYFVIYYEICSRSILVDGRLSTAYILYVSREPRRKKEDKEDAKMGERVKQADGGSFMSLFSPWQAFELCLLRSVIYIQWIQPSAPRQRAQTHKSC